MKTCAIRKAEYKRIDALKKYRILDTEPEREFDEIVKLASLICETPISLISLVDVQRQWFKAKIGIDVTETSRDIAFCSTAIEQEEILIVPDAREDIRFLNNPLVAGDMKMRFYAGMPLATSDGFRLGTLCVIDYMPRQLSDVQVFALQTLAKQVIRQMDLRSTVDRIEEQKISLMDTNRELSSRNHDLEASAEEIRSNLERISELQTHLEVREMQYRGLVENAIDLIYQLNENGTFTFVNSVMEDISGYTKAELLTKKYWDLVHPRHRDLVVRFYKTQQKQRKEDTYLEFMMLTRSGEVVWIGQNVKMFFREDGYVYKVSAISRDITELKKTEDKLERSEKRFRLLSDNSPVGIFETDDNGSCTYVNKRWQEMTGLMEQNALGFGWQEVLLVEGIPMDVSMWKEVISESGEFVWEVQLSNLLGRVKWVTCRVIQVTGTNGAVLGYIGTTNDITEVKEIHSKLTESKERAEEATLAKSKFLSMMSHEIRTPMNAILGLTNLMLREGPRDDQKDSLEMLRYSGESLLTIINDILDFSKIEAGKIEIESHNFHLLALLQNTKKLLASRAKEKHIKLDLECDETLPGMVLGDSVRLGQVLINLVGNAIKFTEKGGVKISVTYQGMVNNSHQIQFNVADTGIGIHRDKITSIFERFSQADSDTTRKFGGTGLGLSIARNLVELMGGNMRVTSEIGVGSSFAFLLPLQAGVAAAKAEVDNSEQQCDFRNESVQILLVEDNVINQIVATKFLVKWGIAVDVAKNGKEAVEMVQKKIYDLLLMDLQMPVMDGYEATQQIRSLKKPYYHNVPIIALSASAMLGMREKVLEVGMNDFISKPFEPDELMDTIRTYVFRRRTNQSAVA